MLRFKGLVLARIAFALVTLAAPVFGADGETAGKEKVLFRFNYTDGWWPEAPVIFDKAGNLYSTTSEYDVGNVFELSPSANGKWKETVLHSFCSLGNCKDGWAAESGVVFDKAGNLYGTTGLGGAYDDGVVFELSPNPDGTWTENILYNFGTQPGDGTGPGGLLINAAGNLYGTTVQGGDDSCGPGRNEAPGCGTIFELSPGAGGQWSEKVIHTFHGPDGGYPETTLIADEAGNLYGTAGWGGPLHRNDCWFNHCGVVFELTPETDGKWTEKVLHAFEGSDGSYPSGNLSMDAAGNLYGATIVGGRLGCGDSGNGPGCGTVFELTPSGEGNWAGKVLRAFYHGRYPLGGVVLDSAGNVYGTTAAGGRYGEGTLFELTASAGGKWTQTTLHSFGGGRDGAAPYSPLIFDSKGNLYGTTARGGLPDCYPIGDTCGTVFEFTPQNAATPR